MSVERRAPRSRSRQAALQVLYALDVGRRGAPAPDPERVEHALDAIAANFELAPGARAYARDTVLGVAEHRDAIDALIAAHAINWRLERMPAVDRNVLRIGIWEMTWGGLPPSVAIDQAVELARRFGADASPAFVNGVLDAVARALVTPAAPGREASRT